MAPVTDPTSGRGHWMPRGAQCPHMEPQFQLAVCALRAEHNGKPSSYVRCLEGTPWGREGGEELLSAPQARRPALWAPPAQVSMGSSPRGGGAH